MADLKVAVDAWAPLTSSAGSTAATLTATATQPPEVPDCRKGVKWVFVDINDDGCLDRDQGEDPLTWGALADHAEPWTASMDVSACGSRSRVPTASCSRSCSKR